MSTKRKFWARNLRIMLNRLVENRRSAETREIANLEVDGCDDKVDCI